MNPRWRHKADTDIMCDDSGLDCRDIGNGKFQFIEVLDMDGHCGKENEGAPKYCCELVLVDLKSIPETEMAGAKRSCGWEDMPDSDAAKAEMCFHYGLKAHLWIESGNNLRQLCRNARQQANTMLNTRKLKEALDKPMNAIGTTNREAMTGNIMGGLGRSVMAGKPEARIIAKMHGVDQYVIDDIRPEDWMPYWCGYLDYTHKRPKQTEEHGKLSPEYYLGYERAERVGKGECPPHWLKGVTNENAPQWPDSGSKAEDTGSKA